MKKKTENHQMSNHLNCMNGPNLLHKRVKKEGEFAYIDESIYSLPYADINLSDRSDLAPISTTSSCSRRERA